MSMHAHFRASAGSKDSCGIFIPDYHLFREPRLHCVFFSNFGAVGTSTTVKFTRPII